MAQCILVVDDDAQSQHMVAEAVRMWGYECLVAADGFEALLKVQEQAPDLVISDLRMRGMSGFELLSVLRRTHPEIVVLCISGEYELLIPPPHVACDAFFLKGSYSLHEIRAKIDELLHGQRRSPLPKTPNPVVWIPKYQAGYYIVTCSNCLRSLPVRGTTEEEHAEQSTTCPHCNTVLTYFIEGMAR